MSGESACQLDGLFDVPATLHPVSRREANEQRRALGPYAANGFDDLETKAYPVFERAAVFIGPRVAQRRKKFVNEITMRPVDLDHIKARGLRSFGRLSECVHDLGNVDQRHRARNRIVAVERRRRRADRLPSSVGLRHSTATNKRRVRAALAARMRQLHADGTALASHETDDPTERADVHIGPDTEIVGADSTVSGDGGGFGEDETGAADRPRRQMDEMPVVGEPVRARGTGTSVRRRFGSGASRRGR